MKTTDKTLQRKTIELTPEDVQEAIIYYLENGDLSYETKDKDGDTDTIIGQPILMGKEVTVSFSKEGAATVITHYP